MWLFISHIRLYQSLYLVNISQFWLLSQFCFNRIVKYKLKTTRKESELCNEIKSFFFFNLVAETSFHMQQGGKKRKKGENNLIEAIVFGQENLLRHWPYSSTNLLKSVWIQKQGLPSIVQDDAAQSHGAEHSVECGK